MAIDCDALLNQLDELGVTGSATGEPRIIAALGHLELDPDARLLLQILDAQARAYRADAKAAADILQATGLQIQNAARSRRHRDQDILHAFMGAARGMVYMVSQHPIQALEHFEMSARLFESLGMNWRAGAMLINSAIALIVTQPTEAMELLDRVEHECEQAPVPDKWKIARRGLIETNRSLVLQRLRDIDGAITELVNARRRIVSTGDRVTLGHTDYNLATLYRQAKRYGSALLAAQSAADNYDSGGSFDNRNRALVLTSAVLREAGRPWEAERLVQQVLAQVSETPDELELQLRTEALSVLAGVYRDTDRYDEAKVVEREELQASQVVPEIAALNEMLRHLFDAIDSVADGRQPAPWPERDATVAVVRDSTVHPLAPELARLTEYLLDAFYEAIQPPPLSSQEVTALAAFNLTSEEWVSLVDVAIGLRSNDDSRTLRGNLADLVRFQREASEQEGPSVRSNMLATRGGTSLDVVLGVLLRNRRHAALFEVIEWCRRDGARMSAETGFANGLLPFAQLAPELGGDEERFQLFSPAGLTIRGTSMMADAVDDLPIIAEADDLRRELAGDDAAWWTAMVHRGAMIWALLTPDGVHGGRVAIDSRTASALEHHFEAMPFPIRRDSDVLGECLEEWCRLTVAIARSALGPLVDDAQLSRRCLAALPDQVAERFDAAWNGRAKPALSDVYGILGDALIPDAVNGYLDSYGDRARLLISIQPELATLPTCLLRTGNGRMLMDRAAVMYTPPVGIAARVARSAYAVGVAHDILTIVDPTSDLNFARPPLRRGRLLSGWAMAPDSRLVATGGNVLASLRALVNPGRPAMLAFIGHIRSGTQGNPGSAALALSPETVYGKPTFWRPSDLGEDETPMAERVYLGGCEGAGFGTSLEWSSVAASALNQGASCVVAHRWPIVDGRGAAIVDQTMVRVMASTSDAAGALRQRQVSWMKRWERRRRGGAVSPHYWAGLQTIGRSRFQSNPSDG